jgi:hypothetical protein
MRWVERRAALLIVALGALPACASPLAQWPIDPQMSEPERRAQTCTGSQGASFIDAPTEAIHHDGLIWLRGERGALASLDVKHATLAHHFISDVVVDLLRTEHAELWVLTYDPGSDDVRVWERTPVGWTPLVQVGAPVEGVLALSEVDRRPLLISPRALYAADEQGLVRHRALARPIERALAYTATIASDGMLWVGVDGGEIGGSLLRIDPGTGAVRRANLADATGGCMSGPSCTHVSALFPDPDDPNCVLASIGSPHGRLTRVCGQTLAPELLASPTERQLSEQTLALAFLHPAGSSERERLRMAAHSLVGLAPYDNMTAASVDSGRRVRALAPAKGGYLAIAGSALYRSDATGVTRLPSRASEARCGLDVTIVDGAAMIESRLHDRTLLVETAAPSDKRPQPAPPCEGAEVYYAWGYSQEAELLDWGYAAFLSCRAGQASLLERGNPNRRVDLERQVWDALWRDLERARWRNWKSCTGSARPDEPRERLVIARGAHTLRVDCPASRHRPEHEAALLRVRHIAGLWAEDRER